MGVKEVRLFLRGVPLQEKLRRLKTIRHDVAIPSVEARATHPTFEEIVTSRPKRLVSIGPLEVALLAKCVSFFVLAVARS